MSKNIVFRCDIKGCGNEIEDDTKGIDSHISKTMQTVFTTDQTEGRSSEPYLVNTSMDICEECIQKVLLGGTIYGSGCQGHNEYIL
jgi:hypothetical protein